jgi:GT2 family glycosyltransferase
LVYAEADVIVPATGEIAPEIPDSQQAQRPAPYNLYVNDLLAAVQDGWVIVLDDDDEFLSRDAVAALEPHFDDPDKLLICKFAMGMQNHKRDIIMPRSFGVDLVLNDVSCSCAVFHSKHKESALWHGNYSGDYFAYSNLAKKLEIEWIDKVVAGTQYGPSVGRSSDSKSYKPWKPRRAKVRKEKSVFLSIVIPVMNQAHFTKDVLANIRETVHTPCEIIIVDNGSDDETPKLLDGCKVIRNASNKGISVSWNQGCKVAKGTHIAILNNDLKLPDGWAETLIAHGKDAICPLYTQGNRAGRRQPTGTGTRPAKPCGISPDGFSGFCFLITRDAWERTGPFDERYFYWFSDRDYYNRLNDMGFQCVQALDVSIHHYGSKTLNTCSDFDEIKAVELKEYREDWPHDPI